MSCNLLALVDELALEFLERSQMKRRGETLLQGGGRRAHSLGVASRDAAQRRTCNNKYISISKNIKLIISIFNKV